MAFPNSFLRWTNTWILPNGEVANSSCSWDPDDAIVSIDEATADEFYDQMHTWWLAIKTYFTSAVGWTGGYLSWINTDGTTLMRIDRPVSAINGDGSGNPLPHEVAAVCSLRTATSTRRTRGRMYLPPPQVAAMTSAGRFDSVFTTAMATNLATALQPITVGLVTYTAVVASATGSLMSPVLAVAVGDVPDAQRRRRDRLTESYVVEPL